MKGPIKTISLKYEVNCIGYLIIYNQSIMATRNSDTRLDIILESPGSEHLRISGIRLPTYNQVLLCYLAYCEKFRN